MDWGPAGSFGKLYGEWGGALCFLLLKEVGGRKEGLRDFDAFSHVSFPGLESRFSKQVWLLQHMIVLVSRVQRNSNSFWDGWGKLLWGGAQLEVF